MSKRVSPLSSAVPQSFFACQLLKVCSSACLPACLAASQISKTYTHYGATALFFFFGLRLLYEAATGAAAAAGESELEEVEKELQVGLHILLMWSSCLDCQQPYFYFC
jgi:hypothetical protein